MKKRILNFNYYFVFVLAMIQFFSVSILTAGDKSTVDIKSPEGNVRIDKNGGVNIQTPQNFVDIGAGVDIQTPEGTVDIGAGGVDIQTPQGSVDIGGSGIEIKTPGGNIDILSSIHLQKKESQIQNGYFFQHKPT